jgi:hypothetical protein
MKIRIPRKKKKWNYKYVIMERSKFPYISKTEKFYYFLDLEYYIKKYNMQPIELYNRFGRITLDHIVWWNYIRKKYLNLELVLDPQTKKYWDWFVRQGIIK